MKKLSYLVLIFSAFLGVGCKKDTPFLMQTRLLAPGA